MTRTTLTRQHLLIIAVVALLARIALFVFIYGIQHTAPDVVGGGDGSAYQAMAHYVYVQGNISNSLFLPRPFFFPVFAALIYQLTGEYVFVIIVINMFLNVMTCLLVYLVARAINQQPVIALVAGLLAAFYPAMVGSSITFMTEPLFLFLFTLFLLVFVHYLLTPTRITLIISMIILAFATLTRLTTMLLPILFIGLLVKRSQKWRQHIAVLLLISTLAPAILTFRNWYYGGIPTFSTEGSWALLFMRATASEHRATGKEPSIIYAEYIQEIERRTGHSEPALESIKPGDIWNYFQPSPEQQAVISKMATEKNLAYPTWYVLNSFYGLHLILTAPSVIDIPSIIGVPLHYAFVFLALIGLWFYWQHDRRWFWVLGLPALLTIGLTIALETSLVDTRHGLGAALPMFILAAQGMAVLISKQPFEKFRIKNRSQI